MPLIKLQPNNVQLGPKPQTHNLHKIKVQIRQDITNFHSFILLQYLLVLLNTFNAMQGC